MKLFTIVAFATVSGAINAQDTTIKEFLRATKFCSTKIKMYKKLFKIDLCKSEDSDVLGEGVGFDEIIKFECAAAKCCKNSEFGKDVCMQDTESTVKFCKSQMSIWEKGFGIDNLCTFKIEEFDGIDAVKETLICQKDKCCSNGVKRCDEIKPPPVIRPFTNKECTPRYKFWAKKFKDFVKPWNFCMNLDLSFLNGDQDNIDKIKCDMGHCCENHNKATCLPEKFKPNRKCEKISWIRGFQYMLKKPYKIPLEDFCNIKDISQLEFIKDSEFGDLFKNSLQCDLTKCCPNHDDKSTCQPLPTEGGKCKSLIKKWQKVLRIPKEFFCDNNMNFDSLSLGVKQVNELKCDISACCPKSTVQCVEPEPEDTFGILMDVKACRKMPWFNAPFNIEKENFCSIDDFSFLQDLDIPMDIISEVSEKLATYICKCCKDGCSDADQPGIKPIKKCKSVVKVWFRPPFNVKPFDFCDTSPGFISEIDEINDSSVGPLSKRFRNDVCKCCEDGCPDEDLTDDEMEMEILKYCKNESKIMKKKLKLKEVCFLTEEKFPEHIIDGEIADRVKCFIGRCCKESAFDDSTCKADFE